MSKSFQRSNKGVAIQNLIKKYSKQIRKIFKEHGVILAYLFGSQVDGDVGKLSDIDIAIYFDDRLDAPERFNKKLKIMAEFSFIFKRDDIDIVVLNDAYPLLEHRILKQGKVIFSISEERRVAYEVKAIMKYLDFEPFIRKYTRETLYGRQR